MGIRVLFITQLYETSLEIPNTESVTRKSFIYNFEKLLKKSGNLILGSNKKK